MNFLQTSIQSIVPKAQTIVRIPKDATVSETLQMLAKNQILSAPLEQSPERGIVFIDMFDVVGALVRLLTEGEGIKQERVTRVQNKHAGRSIIDTEDKALSFSNWNKEKFEQKLSEFLRKPITECLDITKVKNFDVVRQDQPLQRLLEIFKQGIHRVAVVTETNEIRNIVSQSNVMQFLSDSLPKYSTKPMFQLTVLQMLEKYKTKKQKVIKVSTKDTALDAFHKMFLFGVSAVAVCLPGNVIVGNLSICDLRGLNDTNLSSLQQSVEYFLENHVSNPIPEPVCVVSLDTLETVVQTLANNKTHRVWLVNNIQQKKLREVISLTDLMQVLYEYDP